MKKTFLPLLIISTCMHGSELDLGLGFGLLSYPNYLASDQQNGLIFPYPYVQYSSDTLQIDKDGLEQKLFSIDELTLKLSISGSLPVSSSGIREGMPELDPAGEIGPSLLYTVYKDASTSLQMELPIRAVFSTNFKGVDYRGYIYEVKTLLEYKNDNNYLFEFHSGAVFGDKHYHDYLYGVAPEYQTTTRNTYQAHSGYAGYKTSIGISKKFQKFWVGTFGRHYNFTHSSFNNSPLKVKNSSIYGGLAIAYLFDKKVSNKIKALLE